VRSPQSIQSGGPLKEQLLTKLQCPICFEQYDLQAHLPRLLHGGHTLCFACIRTLPSVDASASDGRSAAAAAAASASGSLSLSSPVSASISVKCPLCQHEVVRPVDGFPINFTLVDMLEVLSAQQAGPRCDQCDETATDDEENEDAAVARCVTCDHWLCEFHRTSHKRSRDTKLHDVKTLQEVQEEPKLFRDVPIARYLVDGKHSCAPWPPAAFGAALAALVNCGVCERG